MRHYDIGFTFRRVDDEHICIWRCDENWHWRSDYFFPLAKDDTYLNIDDKYIYLYAVIIRDADADYIPVDKLIYLTKNLAVAQRWANNLNGKILEIPYLRIVKHRKEPYWDPDYKKDPTEDCPYYKISRLNIMRNAQIKLYCPKNSKYYNRFGKKILKEIRPR
jgi:hypothetical protein